MTLQMPTLDDLDAIQSDTPEAKEDEGKIVSVPIDRALVQRFIDAKRIAADNEVIMKTVGAQLKALAEPARIPEVVAAFTLLRRRGILSQSRSGKPTEHLLRDITFDADVRAKALALGLVPQSMLALTKAVSK